MKLPIVKTAITTFSVVVYFRKRKLYVDDKSYKIRILPKKKITVYQKDILNVVGIICSSIVAISIGEKVYVLAKDQIAKHKVTFQLKITERLPSADSTDISLTEKVEVVSVSEQALAEPVDVLSLPDKNTLQPQRKFPTRDIVWIAIAIAIAYYLGQRIDNAGTDMGVSIPSKPDIPAPIVETTHLTWWEKITLPDWMIKDLSDEGTYGQITRPTIPSKDIEPIVNPKPRRIVVFLFSIINKVPKPTNDNDNSTIPWLCSPLLNVLQKLYRRLNK